MRKSIPKRPNLRLSASACKGTKNFWTVQIYLLHFNKNSSTAVPSRNLRYKEFLGLT